jgi:sulfite reductase (NADPH) hemoprotein beta-component
VAQLLDVYVTRRIEGETFLETYRRIGIEAFKEAVYGAAH